MRVNVCLTAFFLSSAGCMKASMVYDKSTSDSVNPYVGTGQLMFIDYQPDNEKPARIKGYIEKGSYEDYVDVYIYDASSHSASDRIVPLKKSAILHLQVIHRNGLEKRKIAIIAAITSVTAAWVWALIR
jgi:hypothetical protein